MNAGYQARNTKEGLLIKRIRHFSSDNFPESFFIACPGKKRCYQAEYKCTGEHNPEWPGSEYDPVKNHHPNREHDCGNERTNDSIEKNIGSFSSFPLFFPLS